MNAATVLVVCTANICRSPVGAALLQDAVVGSGITVTSAGTQAITGHGPVPEAVEYVQRRTGAELRGKAVQITQQLAVASGLILTMTEAQRAAVVRSAPSVLRRVFTLREFVRVLPHLPHGCSYPSVTAIAEAAARYRAHAGPAVTFGDDIEDPYGAALVVYQRSFALIEDAASRVAEALLTRTHSEVLEE